MSHPVCHMLLRSGLPPLLMATGKKEGRAEKDSVRGGFGQLFLVAWGLVSTGECDGMH